MNKIILEVKKRTLLGRKVKKLRQQGIVPANIFGKKITSQAVEVDLNHLKKAYQQAGETNVIEIKQNEHVTPVLLHNIQLHPVTSNIIHVDFYQVDLKEKVKTFVPIEIVGKSSAAEQKQGALLQLLDEIEVEALPTKIPKNITVDISKLTKVGDNIKIADLSVPEEVKILTPTSIEVIKVGELVTKEAAELVQQEKAVAEAKAQKVVSEAAVQPPVAPSTSAKTSS